MGQRKLGRGLDSLMADMSAVTATAPSQEEIEYLSVNLVFPNQFQPRRNFDPEKLQNLVDSIVEHGILQPVSVRRIDDGYELITGERRWKAAAMAGLDKIPAIVRDVSDEEMLELALIENIQRADLNPVERAQAYRRLIQEFELTQEAAASHLGIDRSSLANLLRLLDLPAEVLDALSANQITAGHGRALLALQDPAEQVRLCQRIVHEGLSVRKVEEATSGPKRGRPRDGKKPAYLRELEDTLKETYGTRVIVRKNKVGGRIIIEFYCDDDLNRILGKLGALPEAM